MIDRLDQLPDLLRQDAGHFLDLFLLIRQILVLDGLTKPDSGGHGSAKVFSGNPFTPQNLGGRSEQDPVKVDRAKSCRVQNIASAGAEAIFLAG